MLALPDRRGHYYEHTSITGGNVIQGDVIYAKQGKGIACLCI